MDKAQGKYECTSTQHYAEFFKALGLNCTLQRALQKRPRMEVTERCGEWKIKTFTNETAELTFRLGESFEQTTPDGREVLAIASIEDENKLVCIQTAKKKGHKSTITIREFNEEGCILTMEIIGTDLVSVLKFRRLQ